ncbi:MAG: dCTP deaminase [Candidatus Solibacter sp.]|nr:dCTP deaminase [Candidatus Solibacter sp.]
MILTGSAIAAARAAGAITISPYYSTRLGPNSYDLTLGARCKVYNSVELDSAMENPTTDVPVADDGLLLCPHRVYLFNTEETVGSTKYVPIVRGRSSVGRLGLFVHITADLIDLGSINQLTLQLHAVMPVRVYPGMLIAQVTFWTVDGEITLYDGKYRNTRSPSGSLSYKDDFNGKRF